MAVVAHPLQLLADELALGFNQSQGGAQCGAALKRLLPGLAYLSVAVFNPAQDGTIVGADNCVTDGPTTLRLYDWRASAAGLALARGRTLHASLAGATSAGAAHALTDVQQMVACNPAISHLLCLPFGSPTEGASTGGGIAFSGMRTRSPGSSSGSRAGSSDGSSISSSGSSSSGPQHACSCCGSGSGALLFGFTAQPQLDARRMTLLVRLADCLPTPMARLSADPLAFVNFACGSTPQCPCCWSSIDDSESESEEEADECGICRPAPRWGDGGGDGGGGPSQPLLVPRVVPGRDGGLAEDDDDDDDDSPSPTWRHAQQALGGGEASSTSRAAGTAGGGTPGSAAPPPPAGGDWPVRHSPGNSRGFSKALLSAVAAADDSFLEHWGWSLAFRSPLVEREYDQWSTPSHVTADTVSLLFITLGMMPVVAFTQPWLMVKHAPNALLAMLVVLALLLCLMIQYKERYAAWRKPVIVSFRLATMVFATRAVIPSFQSNLVPGKPVQQWIAYWRLSGAECLFANAVLLQLRFWLHLPLHVVVSFLTAAYNLPLMCGQCFPAGHKGVCIGRGAATMATLGHLVPTLALRYIEQRSRATFLRMLRAAAATPPTSPARGSAGSA